MRGKARKRGGVREESVQFPQRTPARTSGGSAQIMERGRLVLGQAGSGIGRTPKEQKSRPSPSVSLDDAQADA